MTKERNVKRNPNRRSPLSSAVKKNVFSQSKSWGGRSSILHGRGSRNEGRCVEGGHLFPCLQENLEKKEANWVPVRSETGVIKGRGGSK